MKDPLSRAPQKIIRQNKATYPAHFTYLLDIHLNDEGKNSSFVSFSTRRVIAKIYMAKLLTDNIDGMENPEKNLPIILSASPNVGIRKNTHASVTIEKVTATLSVFSKPEETLLLNPEAFSKI